MQPRTAGALAGRHGLGPAHRGHAGAGEHPSPGRRPGGRSAARPQGGRRTPDAHRPPAARPGLAVVSGQRACARVPQRGTLQPRHAPGERSAGAGAARAGHGAGSQGHLSRRHHHRSAQGAGDAGNRGAGTPAARLVHGQLRSSERREGRAEHSYSHGGLPTNTGSGLDGQRAGRGGRRDGFRPATRDPRDGPQGSGAAGGAVRTGVAVWRVPGAAPAGAERHARPALVASTSDKGASGKAGHIPLSPTARAAARQPRLVHAESGPRPRCPRRRRAAAPQHRAAAGAAGAEARRRADRAGAGNAADLRGHAAAHPRLPGAGMAAAGRVSGPSGAGGSARRAGGAGGAGASRHARTGAERRAGAVRRGAAGSGVHTLPLADSGEAESGWAARCTGHGHLALR